MQELLWEIHQLLQSASAKYGVGPRIVKAIKMYINNLPKTEINGFNKGVALDYQIAQRILTKVRGPEIQIGRLLNGKVIQDLIKSLINIASYQILRNVEK